MCYFSVPVCKTHIFGNGNKQGWVILGIGSEEVSLQLFHDRFMSNTSHAHNLSHKESKPNPFISAMPLSKASLSSTAHDEAPLDTVTEGLLGGSRRA